MKLTVGVVAFALLASGCASHARRHAGPHPWRDTVVQLTTNPRQLDPQPVLPPPASTFPKPPTYPTSSCWTRRPVGGPLHEAPQVPARLPRISAATLLSRLRASFGDASVIRAAQLGAPPPITRQHSGYFGPGVRPPKDALWLYLRGNASPRLEWEEHLFAGSLRDELCLHRGRPLVGWSDGLRMGISDAAFPFGQRFATPQPSLYRRRIDAIARAYGFRVASLRFLHALQPVPMIVAQAGDRKKFALDAPAILFRLDPYSDGSITFGGFYLEARDRHGPFLRVFNAHRGIAMGSQWAWDEHYLPYAHF